LIWINHQQILCDIAIFKLKWILFEELHIHDMSSDGSSLHHHSAISIFIKCNDVINIWWR
jgi:hypothetical protein